MKPARIWLYGAAKPPEEAEYFLRALNRVHAGRNLRFELADGTKDASRETYRLCRWAWAVLPADCGTIPPAVRDALAWGGTDGCPVLRVFCADGFSGPALPPGITAAIPAYGAVQTPPNAALAAEPNPPPPEEPETVAPEEPETVEESEPPEDVETVTEEDAEPITEENSEPERAEETESVTAEDDEPITTEEPETPEESHPDTPENAEPETPEDDEPDTVEDAAALFPGMETARLIANVGGTCWPLPHGDCLKLDMLLTLEADGALSGGLRFEDGQALLDGSPMLSLNHIPLYRNNEELIWQGNRLKKLEDPFNLLRDIYRRDPETPGVYPGLVEVTRERDDALAHLRTAEAAVLDLCRAVSRALSEPDLSTRERKIVRLLCRGMYEEALTALREDRAAPGDFLSGGAGNVGGSAEESILPRLRANRLRAAVLATRPSSPADIEREQCLAVNATAALCQLDRVRAAPDAAETLDPRIPAAMREYAALLYDAGRFREARAWCEHLDGFYRAVGGGAGQVAAVLLLLGQCCQAEGDGERAESVLREAHALCEMSLSGKGVADAAETLAALWERAGHPAEAERLYRLLLRHYHRGTAREKSREAAAAARLASVCHSLGRRGEAEQLYCDAMDLYKELSKERPAAYGPYLAETCRLLALLLGGAGRPKAAEWFYRQTLDACRAASGKASGELDALAAEVCGDLARLVGGMRRTEEAERLYRTALDAWRKLSEREPVRYREGLARACGAFAVSALHRHPEESRVLLKEALSLWERGGADGGEEAERLRILLDEYFPEERALP